MDKALLKDFPAEFDDNRYPADFSAEYEAMECLAHHDAGETLLVKNRQTGGYFVAKCYGDKSLPSMTEGELLKRLCHPGLPGFIGEYLNERMTCVVREYVEGLPLDQYASQKGLPQEQSIAFVIQLCDILSYLHEQTPPVIHRDIKPQNIIVDQAGKIKLIDFGISRVYDETARKDTLCFGTRGFAAPEQYGFSQTDHRADIFSLGVLLGWLLTGKSDIADILRAISNPRLRRIVRKCAAFAPDGRYASVKKVKADLLNADGHRQKRILRFACGFLVCAVCLCAGFAIGRYTELKPAFLESTGVSFHEPLIERAVRIALNKPENEPIEESELLNVTELYIYGDRVAADRMAYEELAKHMIQNDGVLKNGDIRSLEDLAKLKNLRTLFIALQDVGDVSALSGLADLAYVDLRHNPIEDVTPLAALSGLRELCVYDTHVSDLSALAACPLLQNIDAGNARITSITAFTGIRSLMRLSVRQTTLKTISGIEEFTYLEQIGLSSVSDGDLTPLMVLSWLKEAHLDEALRQAAERDLKQAAFDIVYS